MKPHILVQKIANLLSRDLSFKVFIKSHGWSTTLKNGEIAAVKEKTKLSAPVFLRAGTSDLDVFRQTFINDGYGKLLDYAQKHHARFLQKEKIAILDCGSNIGLSALYFISALRDRDLLICCVEPDPENYALNVKNTAPYPFVKVLHRAVWDAPETLAVNRNFRDNKHWSRNVTRANGSMASGERESGGDFESPPDFATSSAEEALVKGITMSELLDLFPDRHIDILKIDIEGAEARLFADDSMDEILKNVESIAIEIHDEFDCRQMICDRLSKNDFHWSQAGELTIGIKKQQTES